jgi:hypothetical protein
MLIIAYYLRNFSAIELQEFDTINLKIKEKYDAYEQKQLAREKRKRLIGAGHLFKLSLTDRFLMCAPVG